MLRPIHLAALLAVFFAVATILALVSATKRSFQESCEVCVSYLGRTECRVAAGTNRDEAIRTATDNACAFLASGMTQSVECTTRTRPVSATCASDSPAPGS